MITTFKPKPCANCGSLFHTKSYHNPRKPLVTRTHMKPPSKPMRKEAVKTRKKREATTAAWFEANPPDEQGHWRCYISKHPMCPVYLTRQTINLEHDISKARGPEFKYDITNIFPACSFDNRAKGSLSAAEYMAYDTYQDAMDAQLMEDEEK